MKKKNVTSAALLKAVHAKSAMEKACGDCRGL